MVRSNSWVRWVVVLVFVLAALPALAQPVGTAFTYQGRLQDNGTPANAAYDLRFILYDAAVVGSQVGPIVDRGDIAVASGLFTVSLDFGAVFAGNKRFLEVQVRPGASTGAYTTLGARQELAPAPNAVNASALGGQAPTYYTDLANHTGTLADARLSANIPRLNAANTFSDAQSISGSGLVGTWMNLANSSAGGHTWTFISTGQNNSEGAGKLLFRDGTAGTVPLVLDSTGITGTFSGSGLGLTNLNASNLGSGTVADARLSANIPRLDAANTFSEAQSISGGGLFGTWMNLANSSAGGRAWNFISTGQNNGEGAGKLLFRDGTTGTVPLVLDSAGRVGVGTPFPETRLQVDVAGSAGTAPSLLVGPSWDFSTPHNQGNQQIGIFAWNGRPGLTLANHNVGGWLMETDGQQLYFQRGWDGAGGTAMTLDTAGNVGIGTYPVANTRLRVLTLTTGGTVASFGDSGEFRIDAPGIEGGRLIVKEDGRVGIGITSPGARLDVRTANGASGSFISNTGTGVVSRGGFTGVSGRADYEEGTGVYGFGYTYGVRGENNNPNPLNPGFAVYATGKLGASGTKSFRIDHPDDPENKYLLHYSAESPEVINFYSETVTLDARGEAVVELPHYFAKINTRPRYQLTAVGAPMPMLHVAEKISNAALNAGAEAGPDEAAPVCSFRIAGGVPGGEVSWEVKAVRNDLWVRKSGAAVEVEKEGREKGTYQHPDLYGQPPEKGMLYDLTREGREPVAGTTPR